MCLVHYHKTKGYILYVLSFRQLTESLTLGLDGVEEGEEVRVQLLVVGVTEGGDGEWLEVEELGGWRELLRQNEVAERDGQLGLRGQPLVRDDSDEVLGREWLEDRDKETDHVLVLRILGLEEEVLVVEDEFRVNVLHKDPECLQHSTTATHNLLIGSVNAKQ